MDLAQVAGAGNQFVILKATEGVTFRDLTFPARWAQAAQVGLVRLAYHFARPDLNGPLSEATQFLTDVLAEGPLQPGDGLVLDLERGNGDLRAWTLLWLRTVEAAVGFKPFLYTGAWFAEPHGLTNSAELGQYGLWLAAYQATMPPPLPGWEFVALWQNSDTGVVPGVLGACDTDVFNGTIDQLRLYGAPAGPPTPPLPPLPPTPPAPPVMTNDDYVAVTRLLLGDGTGPLNAPAAYAYLKAFVQQP